MRVINIGAINGRRTVTFKVTNDGMVVRALFKDLMEAGFEMDHLREIGAIIPARESFRRWKVARKAWATRRIGKQLLLKL